MENIDKIQIKPLDDEEKNKFYTEEERKKKEEQYNFDVWKAGKYLSRLTKDGDLWSETITLNQNGEIDTNTFMNNSGRTLLEASRSVDLNRDGLNKLIDEITEKFKHLVISLNEKDNDLTLTVENKIKKNLFAQWISQGIEQWSEPKRIVHISEDGLLAFVDGSMTGVPIDQLEVII